MTRAVNYLTSLHTTRHKFCDLKFSAQEVFRLMKTLNFLKATGLDKILVVVLKKLSPELSTILAKLFNHWLKEKYFPSLESVSSFLCFQEC